MPTAPVALVTGASRGSGRAIAEALAAAVALFAAAAHAARPVPAAYRVTLDALRLSAEDERSLDAALAASFDIEGGVLVARGGVEAVLRAVEGEAKRADRKRTFVAASAGSPARLSVSEAIPFVEETVFYAPAVVATGRRVAWIDAGTVLEVTVRPAGETLVSVAIATTERAAGETVFPSGPPRVSEASLATSLLAPLGRAVLLGGAPSSRTARRDEFSPAAAVDDTGVTLRVLRGYGRSGERVEVLLFLTVEPGGDLPPEEVERAIRARRDRWFE